jgi:hypothetical protein
LSVTQNFDLMPAHWNIGKGSSNSGVNSFVDIGFHLIRELKPLADCRLIIDSTGIVVTAAKYHLRKLSISFPVQLSASTCVAFSSSGKQTRRLSETYRIRAFLRSGPPSRWQRNQELLSERAKTRRLFCRRLREDIMQFHDHCEVGPYNCACRYALSHRY